MITITEILKELEISAKEIFPTVKTISYSGNPFGNEQVVISYTDGRDDVKINVKFTPLPFIAIEVMKGIAYEIRKLV